jgi:hypothetical protein
VKIKKQEKISIEVSNIDHLRIVVGIINEIGLTGWLVSLMVDIVIIWDNKLNNNSIKKGMGFWVLEVAIANLLLSAIIHHLSWIIIQAVL